MVVDLGCKPSTVPCKQLSPSAYEAQTAFSQSRLFKCKDAPAVVRWEKLAATCHSRLPWNLKPHIYTARYHPIHDDPWYSELSATCDTQWQANGFRRSKKVWFSQFQQCMHQCIDGLQGHASEDVSAMVSCEILTAASYTSTSSCALLAWSTEKLGNYSHGVHKVLAHDGIHAFTFPPCPG